MAHHKKNDNEKSDRVQCFSIREHTAVRLVQEFVRGRAAKRRSVLGACPQHSVDRWERARRHARRRRAATPPCCPCMPPHSEHARHGHRTCAAGRACGADLRQGVECRNAGAPAPTAMAAATMPLRHDDGAPRRWSRGRIRVARRPPWPPPPCRCVPKMVMPAPAQLPASPCTPRCRRRSRMRRPPHARRGVGRDRSRGGRRHGHHHRTSTARRRFAPPPRIAGIVAAPTVVPPPLARAPLFSCGSSGVG